MRDSSNSLPRTYLRSCEASLMNAMVRRRRHVRRELTAAPNKCEGHAPAEQWSIAPNHVSIMYDILSVLEMTITRPRRAHSLSLSRVQVRGDAGHVHTAAEDPRGGIQRAATVVVTVVAHTYKIGLVLSLST